MADLRIGLAAEGPTDYIVINAALEALLPGRTFVLTQLQPANSLGSPPDAAARGTGWPGVYRWCREMSRLGGNLAEIDQLKMFDALVLHLDGDVSQETYGNGNIADAPADNLPCACAEGLPAIADELKSVFQSWLSPATAGDSTVFCLPWLCTETWCILGLDTAHDPDGEAEAWDKDAITRKSCELGFIRYKVEQHRRTSKKRTKFYREKQTDITAAWPAIEKRCSQARAFGNGIRALAL